MPTSREIVNRIRWDPRWGARRFTIGYRERGKSEPREKPLLSWDETIPWHRVEFVALDGKRVWDRAGLDLVTSGEALALAPPATVASDWDPIPAWRWNGSEWAEERIAPQPPRVPLRVVTWNVLSDRHEPAAFPLARRLPRLLARLRALDADVLALEEVTPRILEALLAESWVRAAYATSDRTGETLKPEGQLVLARPRVALRLRTFANAKHALLVGLAGLDVVVLHLTSDRARDATRKRAEELAAITAAVGEDALLVGDFNAREESLVPGFDDLWRARNGAARGDTYDPVQNALATATSITGLPARYDRALLRSAGLEASRVALVREDEPVSDHEGLVVELARPARVDDAAEEGTALALLASGDASIDAIRRAHDPAHARWPAHVNLFHPFVPEARFDAARELVARALGSVLPFEVTLGHFSVFEHGASATVHLAVESPALERVRASLAERFPRCATATYTPHLTVGRFGSTDEARAHAAAFARTWKPVRFPARELALLARDGEGRFVPRATVSFGGALGSWLLQRGEAGSEDDARRRAAVVERVRSVVPDVEVGGSTRLGVAIPASDLDLATRQGDLAGLARTIEARLGVEVVVASDARAPVARFVLDGIVVDLQSGDASVREAVATRELALSRGGAYTWEVALRTVRAWARARCLDAQAWGFLGGSTWARFLVAHLPAGVEGDVPEAPPESVVAAFFERASAEPWPASVEETATSVTHATRAALEEELARAARITARMVAGRAAAGEGSWDELVESPSTRGSHVATFAASPEVLAPRALGLVRDLERARGVRRVRPLPLRGAARVAIDLELSDRTAAEELVSAFATSAGVAWRLRGD